MKKNDHLSLEQLEKDAWPEPDYNSYLVATCHKLRKKRLSDFGVEDLRIMIGQSIGLKYLLPKAIETLRQNPFSEGDFYEGDLLIAVVRLPANNVPIDEVYKEDLALVCQAALNSVEPKLADPERDVVAEFLSNLLSHSA